MVAISLHHFVAILVKVDRGFPGYGSHHKAPFDKSQSLLKWIGDSLVLRLARKMKADMVAILVKVDRGFPENFAISYLPTR